MNPPFVPNDTVSANYAYAIIPSDTNSFNPTRGLMVGVSGNVSVRMAGGKNVVVLPVIAGIQYALRVTQVLNTGTTATNIIGFW